MSEATGQASDPQRPGTKVRSRLPVPGVPGGLPAIRVVGPEPGPSPFITGGVHGGEYFGIEAAIPFAAGLDPGAIHGQVTVVPLVNPPSF